MDDFGTIFSLNNWPGHLSYVLIAVSYWLTDMFRLRLVAVVGLTLEILYFWFSGGDLRTGIGWDIVFIGINAYQLYRLLQDRLSLRLPEADQEVLRSALSGLNDAQIARLLIAGEFCEIAPGTTLAKENTALNRLFFICAGRVRVTIAGREVSHLEGGNFVGEVAFLTEQPATATVIADAAVRALVFRKDVLICFSGMRQKLRDLSISSWVASSPKRSRSATAWFLRQQFSLVASTDAEREYDVRRLLRKRWLSVYTSLIALKPKDFSSFYTLRHRLDLA